MDALIRCIIIDDEPGNIETLQELLKRFCPKVIVVGTARNPIEGQRIIETQQPDLVILDIEMPYGNAFDLLDKIKPVKFEIIFVTAFNNYAIKAFKYAAIDYLLKPVNISELQHAVERVSHRLNEKSKDIKIESLFDYLKMSKVSNGKIGLPTIDGMRLEDLSNIIYLRAEGSYTIVSIKGNVTETVSKNLKEYEDILPEFFCRVHHSFIININYVKKYYKGRGGFVEMTDGTRIEISVRKKDEFLRHFMH